MNIKFPLKYIALAIFVVFITPELMAQIPGGGTPPGGGPGGCFPNPCVPIDGGISFLVAAGLAFGGKKLYDARKS